MRANMNTLDLENHELTVSEVHRKNQNLTNFIL